MIVPAGAVEAKAETKAFFRKAFYFGTDGTTITDRPGCPPVTSP